MKVTVPPGSGSEAGAGVLVTTGCGAWATAVVASSVMGPGVWLLEVEAVLTSSVVPGGSGSFTVTWKVTVSTLPRGMVSPDTRLGGTPTTTGAPLRSPAAEPGTKVTPAGRVSVRLTPVCSVGVPLNTRIV